MLENLTVLEPVVFAKDSTKIARVTFELNDKEAKGILIVGNCVLDCGSCPHSILFEPIEFFNVIIEGFSRKLPTFHINVTVTEIPNSPEGLDGL